MKVLLEINYFFAAVGHYCTLGVIGRWKVYYPISGKYSCKMSYYEARTIARLSGSIMVWEW